MSRRAGQPLAGSFMDYAMPRADTFPQFTTEIVEVLSPTNPLGIKAGGEGGTTPALAVIVNAVCDALKDFGVEDISLIYRALGTSERTPVAWRLPSHNPPCGVW